MKSMNVVSNVTYLCLVGLLECKMNFISCDKTSMMLNPKGVPLKEIFCQI